jgi:hypothetical protein
MTDSQGAALAFFYSSEFRRKWSKVHTNGRGGEEYFAFWGFTLSEHIRNLLLSLIAFVFKTRLIFASNTNETQFECVCIMNSATAGVLRTHCEVKDILPQSTVEDSLLWFLELFNMSADVVRFDKLLSMQMVSSIDRLERTKSPAFGSLHTNSDFYALYRCIRAQRDDNASARILTGYELSTDSLCRLTRSLKASKHKVRAVESQLAHAQSCLRAKEAELRTLQARETDARRDESSRMNAGRLILALKHIGDLSEATALKLLQALRFRAVPVNELIMTRFGNSTSTQEPQEVLVQDTQTPREGVRILQRVPQGPEPHRVSVQAFGIEGEAAVGEFDAHGETF